MTSLNSLPKVPNILQCAAYQNPKISRSTDLRERNRKKKQNTAHGHMTIPPFYHWGNYLHPRPKRENRGRHLSD